MTQTYEEAHRKLKVNEETMLQLKKQLFDSKQKNERYEMDKKLIDFIYNGEYECMIPKYVFSRATFRFKIYRFFYLLIIFRFDITNTGIFFLFHLA